MPSFFQIVANTPLWVWPLMVFVLWLGLQGLRPRVIPVWRLAILPVVGLATSLSGIAQSADPARAATGWALVIGCIVALRQIEAFNRWPIVIRMALAGILAAVPMTATIIVVHDWLAWPTPWRAFPYIFPQTAFLTVVISIMVGLFVERRLHAEADSERARVAESVAAAPAPGVEPVAPDFFRRVPPALGRDLLALEMEDHYLRIHTALGSDLILLRLRDALTELGPSCGRQVHRSWWVAEGAIGSVERNAGRNVLVLRNGLRVPVSKTFREQVKEAGWLD